MRVIPPRRVLREIQRRAELVELETDSASNGGPPGQLAH
jgi:hypothetical protein